MDDFARLNIVPHLALRTLLVALGVDDKMNDQRVSQEILTKAADAVGGEEALAKALERSREEVREWLSGARPIPMNVYLEACRLLSNHPDSSAT